MSLSAGEKIRILLVRRGMSYAKLAASLPDESKSTASNICNKLRRNNFSERELQEIAAALNCTYEAKFTMNDTHEEI